MTFLINSGYQKRTTDVATNQRVDYWREFICQEFVKLDCKNFGDKTFDGEIRGDLNLGELRFSEVLADPEIVTRSRAQISRSSDNGFLITKILQYIDNNNPNPRISNQDIADAHRISLRYLYKLFQQHDKCLHQLVRG